MIGAESIRSSDRSGKNSNSRAPFGAQPADGTGAVLPPEAAARPFLRQQWLLAIGRIVFCDRHQCCNRPAMPCDDGRAALLGGTEKFRELITRFFCAFTDRRGLVSRHGETVRCRTEQVNPSQRRNGDGAGRQLRPYRVPEPLAFLFSLCSTLAAAPPSKAARLPALFDSVNQSIRTHLI